jgi:hypothetical protein
LPGGGCGIGCTSDADCGGSRCATAASGFKVCTNGNSFLPFCTPCVTDADCYLGCSAINVFCDAGTCRAVL